MRFPAWRRVIGRAVSSAIFFEVVLGVAGSISVTPSRDIFFKRDAFMLEWELNAYAETYYASAKVGQKGDPLSNVAVVVVMKPVESGGEAGREQWCDPFSKKL